MTTKITASFDSPDMAEQALSSLRHSGINYYTAPKSPVTSLISLRVNDKSLPEAKSILRSSQCRSMQISS